MEKILRIEEVTGSGMDGFVVVTTEQEIRLMIDSGQSCCERWGYFWCNDNPQDFIGADVLGLSLTDTALKTKALEEINCDEYNSTMFVNINTNMGVLQFVAYNSHNGYYGHMARVSSRQLNKEECL